MKIYKGSIGSNLEYGYLTLQVGEVTLGSSAPDTIEVPDDWFIRLRGNDRPCVGRESGFLFLTEKGFKENEAELRAALAKGGNYEWYELEQHANEHFLATKRAARKYVKILEKKLNTLKAFLGEDV